MTGDDSEETRKHEQQNSRIWAARRGWQHAVACGAHVEVHWSWPETRSVSVVCVACSSAELPGGHCVFVCSLETFETHSTSVIVFAWASFSLSAAQAQGLAQKRPSAVLLSFLFGCSDCFRCDQRGRPPSSWLLWPDDMSPSFCEHFLASWPSSIFLTYLILVLPSPWNRSFSTELFQWRM